MIISTKTGLTCKVSATTKKRHYNFTSMKYHTYEGVGIVVNEGVKHVLPSGIERFTENEALDDGRWMTNGFLYENGIFKSYN